MCSKLVGMSLAAAVLGGCASIDVEFPYLPSAEALGSIRPGVTTRSEVLRLLGPPEEIRRPAAFERGRSVTPQQRRVLDARDLFSRDAYTYASEHRDIDVFGLLPVGPALFRVAWIHSAENRWRIEFDEHDVVRAVSHVDEREDP